MCTVESLRCALWRVLDVHCALCRDVQLAEETSYGVQTVLVHATTLEDDDNDDDDDVDDGDDNCVENYDYNDDNDDDDPHLMTLNMVKTSKEWKTALPNITILNCTFCLLMKAL